MIRGLWISGILSLWVSVPPCPAVQEDDANAPKNTAHVKAYAELDQLLQRAPLLESEKRWQEALAIYEKALAAPRDVVVPLDKVRAVGLRSFVLGRLAAWPEEGRAALRRRLDPAAEQSFQAASRSRDPRALEAFADDHPLSSFAAGALALAGTLRLDEGDATAAAWAFERILAAADPVDRPVVAARLGLALARLGDRARLDALAGRAAREWPAATVQVRGKAVPLALHLRALAPDPVGPAPLDIPGWEMMGGSPNGRRLAESGVRLPRAAWAERIDIPRLDSDEEPGLRRPMVLPQTADFRPLFPAVADGIVYVQNGLSVVAFNLFSHQAERLWQFKVPPPGGEVMFDNRIIYTVTAHEGTVYANLVAAAGGAEDQLGYVRVKFPFARRAMYALDGMTGRPLWRTGGVPGSDLLSENASFATAPTPEGARLYAGAVKQKHSTDPFEHYVVCLDAASGKILWSTFVASGGTEINLFGNSTRESLGSPVAIAGDLLLYSTNHGVIAALEKTSGRIRWTYRYKQRPIQPTRSVYVSKNSLEWVSGPPVAAGGAVVIAPTDSPHAYALDASTGELLWEKDRPRDLRYVLGAKGGSIVFGGARLEFVDLRSGETTALAGEDLMGAGRGVPAADAIYVPCRTGLRRVGWDGTWTHADFRPWPAGGGDGGNLTVVDGAVILARQEGIEVYYDRRDQEQAIKDALAAEPNNPRILYRGALRWLQAGRPDEAAALLSRAVQATAQAAGSDDQRLHRMARKRLFAVSLEAGRTDLDARRLDVALARLSTARDAAPDAVSEVEARLLLGHVQLARKDDARAVDEFQSLLRERGALLYQGTRVFDVARRAIGAILIATGPTPYARHEADAGAALEKARRDRTADAFRAIFQAYPNSAAAEQALFEAARAEARLERPDAEIAAWRVFAAEFPASSRTPEALAELVRALEKKGHVASAAVLVRRLARDFPEAEVPEGEGRATGRDFAERRLRSEAYTRAAVAAPPVRLASPLEPKPSVVDKEFPDNIPLRLGGAPPPAAAGLLFLHLAKPSGAAVKAVDVETGKDLWTLHFPTLIRFASFLEDGLVLADERKVVRVDDLRSGRTRWTWEAPSRMRSFALVGASLVFLAPDPRDDAEMTVAAVDALSGQPAWTRPFDGIVSSRVHAAGEAVVFTTVQPNRIWMFEADTGRRTGPEGDYPEGLPSQVAHVGPDVLVLMGEGRAIDAYDLPSGKLRWRVPVPNTAVRAVEASPDALTFLAMRRLRNGPEEGGSLRRVALKSGKLQGVVDDLGAGDPRYLAQDGQAIYVISRQEDGTFRVDGRGVADLKLQWSAVIGGGREATLLPPALAAGHLVVTSFEQGEDGKFGYAAGVLDKGGKEVQYIRSPRTFDRPPVGALVPAGLVFSVDSRVDVWR